MLAADFTAAETPAPVKTESLAKCAAPPVIDGVLNAAEWQGAPGAKFKGEKEAPPEPDASQH